VDVAATNISCTTLSINGEPVSNILKNVGETSTNHTVFIGSVKADTLEATTSVLTPSLTSTTTSAGALSCTSLVNSGSVSATSVTATGAITGATLAGTVSTATQNSITKIGTQTSFAVSGASALASVAASGNITQSAGTAQLKATTVDSLTIGTKSLSFYTGAQVTSASGTFTIPLTQDHIHVTFTNVASTSLSNLYLQPGGSGTCAGYTSGMKGGATVTWASNTAYVWADTAASIPANQTCHGRIDFYRINATTFLIAGFAAWDDSTTYYTAMDGTLSNTTSIDLKMGPGTVTGNVYYTAHT
jgi:hypothetical protein